MKNHQIVKADLKSLRYNQQGFSKAFRPTFTTVLLSLVLITTVTGCKSSEESSAKPPQSENPASIKEGSSSEDKKALSPESRQKREEMHKKVKAVLDPEQVKQLDAKMQEGERMRQALTSINLTVEQKAKIQEIYQANRPPKSAKG
jgi:hypothetical protein